MAELLRVPEVAAGATEVVLSEWLIGAGDAVSAGDPVAVVETDKAIVEIEAPADGLLLRALADGGAHIAVGSAMALLGSAAERDLDTDQLMRELDAPSSAPSPPSPAPVPDASPGSARATPGTTARTERLFISPLARRMLHDAGLDAAEVEGTGPRGRIRKRDVEAALAARPTHASSAAPATDSAASRPAADPLTAYTGAEVVPHSRSRRAVAARLTRSKQEVPHFYVRRSAVLDDLLDLRAKLNEQSQARLSVNDFMIRAVAVAHTRVPDANVIWAEDGMRRFDRVDISVAIASERGLVTPVVRDVSDRPLSSVSATVKMLAEQADAGRLRQEDLEGGSIGVTNLGMYGVEEFSAIINPPQSAILAVGAAERVPRVAGGAIGIATAVNLVLSVDHRAIDGALAAQWMAALVDALENPLRLLA